MCRVRLCGSTRCDTPRRATATSRALRRARDVREGFSHRIARARGGDGDAGVGGGDARADKVVREQRWG
jgi:hypothetical protein